MTTTHPAAAASPRVKAARPADNSVHRARPSHTAARRGRGTWLRASSHASRPAVINTATAMASRVPASASRYGASSE